jgi:hypothetical protein
MGSAQPASVVNRSFARRFAAIKGPGTLSFCHLSQRYYYEISLETDTEISMLYNLAILGRGSAAAYYLNTIDQNEFPKIIVIGMDDPWDEKRGVNPYDARDPMNYINQTAQMIAHYSDTAPAYSEDLVPRRNWSSANKRVIDQCNVKMVKGTIQSVKKVVTPEPYKVAFDRPEFVFHRLSNRLEQR